MNTKENQELSALIGQATAGDKAALEAVLSGVQDLVFNLSLRMLGTFHDAEDASQGQDCVLYILGQIGHILSVPTADVVSIELKAQGKLGEHMLFIVLEVVHRDTEYPGGEGALPLKRGQVGHDFQHILCRARPPASSTFQKP